MSLRYTGAKALKTDFTRTGQRSLKGVASDAKQSTIRLIFFDFFFVLENDFKSH